MPFVTTFERLGEERGLAKGLEQGRAQARELAEQKLQAMQAGALCRLLTRRFGTLPAWAYERLGTASQAQFDLWFDRLLDVETVDDVFAPQSPGPSSDKDSR